MAQLLLHLVRPHTCVRCPPAPPGRKYSRPAVAGGVLPQCAQLERRRYEEWLNQKVKGFRDPALTAARCRPCSASSPTVQAVNRACFRRAPDRNSGGLPPAFPGSRALCRWRPHRCASLRRGVLCSCLPLSSLSRSPACAAICQLLRHLVRREPNLPGQQHAVRHRRSTKRRGDPWGGAVSARLVDAVMTCGTAGDVFDYASQFLVPAFNNNAFGAMGCSDAFDYLVGYALTNANDPVRRSRSLPIRLVRGCAVVAVRRCTAPLSDQPHRFDTRATTLRLTETLLRGRRPVLSLAPTALSRTVPMPPAGKPSIHHVAPSLPLRRFRPRRPCHRRSSSPTHDMPPPLAARRATTTSA